RRRRSFSVNSPPTGGLSGLRSPFREHEPKAQEIAEKWIKRMRENKGRRRVFETATEVTAATEHRGPGAFRAWLRGILANRLRKYFRDRPPSAAAIDLDAVADPDSVLGRAWDREHNEYLAAWSLRLVEGDFAPATWAAFRRQVLDGRRPREVAAVPGERWA